VNQLTPTTDTSSGTATAGDGRDARWDGHRNRKREELIRSVRRSVHRYGPGVSMDRISAEAGTSKSVLYRYFSDKEGLRAAVAEDVVRALREGIISAGRTATDPRAALLGMIEVYLSQAQASPNTYSFVVSTSGDAAGEVAASVDAVTEELVSLFQQRLPELLPGDDPGSGWVSELWPTAALGLIRNAGERWLTEPASTRLPAPELARLLTGWLLNGLTPLPDVAARRA